MFPVDFLQTTPHSPGVYLMLGKKSVILYVGKAKDLHKRLASYARFSGAEHNKTAVMLARVERVETIITRTEKEALILEASLIKRHKPRYNIILRDDKSYPMIKVTVQEEWPRVQMTRRRKKDGARYFGPYASASSMWATLKLITTLFPLRRCRDEVLRPRKRPCLNGQMKHCLAPCVNPGPKVRATYREHVDKILMILEGRNTDLVARLGQQMRQASEALEFEKAGQIRDQIQALERTLERQVVIAGHVKDQDVFGLIRKGAAVGIAILFIRSGIVSGSRTYFLEDPYGDDQALLAQVLQQYYFDGGNLPQEILLSIAPDDLDLLAEHFGEMSDAKVTISIPQRGDRTQLIAMAQANAEQIFAEQGRKERSWLSLSQAMRQKLHLNRLPDRIECLDISNISGRQAVGSLVCFRQGHPGTDGYRHYKIKTVSGPDDYAMMGEVLERRLSRGVREDNLPDLFVVDGGRGQLGMALQVAKDLGITDDVDWIGIAKEREDEGEKLYKPGRKNPIILPSHDPVLLYLMRIRDEAHRYGITFHRKLRGQSSLRSELDAIPGVGPSRKRALLRHLGSLRQVKAASPDQLAEVSGIGPELAGEIHAFLHPK
ncbi:MAG: excinuclease ABC subunit UvrC [Desulfocapsaceae bacterium]|nr:excinuclease ABC subunit UvrC [Desulfocapsaceae bacterium]